MARFSALSASLAIGLLIGGYLIPRLDALLPADSTPREVTKRGPLEPNEQATIRLFKECARSVVYITSMQERTTFFGRAYEERGGQGSGFVWDKAGHIVTNSHVILNADAITVTLSDHKAYDAKFVGWAPTHDLAVLQIDAGDEQLYPVSIGTSHDLEVGQTVLAIGNPFGLDQTLTTGIVSALGRKIQSIAGRDIEDVIQTDAAINPGNSGGPLLDSSGRLIGINTAIYSAAGQSAGIGFAVPVDTINQIVPELIAFGKIIRPEIGFETLNDQKNLAVMRRYGTAGLMVLSVKPGLGADRAGVRGIEYDRKGRVVPGDIIQEADGQKIEKIDDLNKVLESHKPGDVVKLKLLRDGDELKVSIKLSAPET